MDTSPIGLKRNWVTVAGGLPLYIRAVAHAFIRKGMPESQAIQRAVGVVRDWSRGSDGKGGHVTAGTQAKAAAALAQWTALKARAHAHANDGDALELAAPFNPGAHPRVAKGHGNAGQFGSSGTALKAKPAVAPAGFKPAAATPAAVQVPPPPPAPAPSPATQGRVHALHHQAKQDRALAHTITAKANALVRVRDGYIAGVLTATGKSTTATPAVSAAKSAAAKKAAATVKANGGRKKAAVSSTKSAASTKAANVGKLNGEIHLLRADAKSLLKSADHLDALASSL